MRAEHSRPVTEEFLMPLSEWTLGRGRKKIPPIYLCLLYARAGSSQPLLSHPWRNEVGVAS